MRRSLTVLLLVAGLTGCYQEELSGILHESAKVIRTEYLPSQTNTTVTITTDQDGDIVPVVYADHTPEQHIVEFLCQHGKFAIDDATRWKRLEVGDQVEITYREKYHVWHKDGKETCRERIGFQFLDAYRVTGEAER